MTLLELHSMVDQPFFNNYISLVNMTSSMFFLNHMPHINKINEWASIALKLTVTCPIYQMAWPFNIHHLSHAYNMPCPFHSPWFDHPNNI